MKIIDPAQLKTRPVEQDGVKDVQVCKPVTSSDGAPNFAMRQFTVAPGGHTPYHRHPFEHLNYIISGEGALRDEAGVLHALRPGNYAIVHPDDLHQFVNTGQEPFVMICAVPLQYE